MSTARPNRLLSATTTAAPALLLALLALGLTACSAEPEFDFRGTLEELQGQIVTTQPFLVLPNRAWRADLDNGWWYFGRSASMICVVREAPFKPLVFGFLPAEPARAPTFEVLWNGRDLSSAVEIHESGEIRIEIPLEELVPGTHFLTLRREGGSEEWRSGSPESEEELATFRFIGYRQQLPITSPEFTHDQPLTPYVLPVENFLSFRYLANLLNFGLTSRFERERLAGFVTIGQRRVRLDLGSEAGGLFQARVQNSAEGAAAFRVRVGGELLEYRLAAAERRHLRLRVPPGTDHLEMSNDGDPNGFFHWGAPHFSPADGPDLPPIILVTLDTTRRDVLAAYGGDPAITPRLNAFAAAATVFDNAYSTAPWTLPAHASMFTGLYPSRHGAGVNVDHLEIHFTTLAEHLRRRGYLTAGFVGGMLSSARFGVGQGFSLYTDTEGLETPGDELTREAILFLRESVAARATLNDLEASDGDSRPPFFLFLNYFDPHFPYQAPERFKRRFRVDTLAKRVADATWLETLAGSPEAWARIVEGEVPATPSSLAALEAAYRAEVAFMDAELGRLLDELQALELYDDALIVITADHGELLGEGGFFSHSARLDSELIEVPLLIKWPGQEESRRDGRLVTVADLFPTLMRFAGAAPRAAGQGRAPIDGLAIRPDGAAPEFERRSYVVLEEHDADFHRLPFHMRIADELFGLQGRSYRQISWDGGESCYRRQVDAGGGWTPDVCNAARSELARRLRQELRSQAYEPRIDRIGLTREERDQLRALGYLD